MTIEGGRLASIGIAGLMMCLVGAPYAALGHGEADAQMAEPAAFGAGLSRPQLDTAAARAQAIVVAEASAINQVVPANQLNEIDRAASNDAFRSRTTGANGGTTRRMAPAIVAATDNSFWDTTSMIGKIFVIFGALLTVASAARMFMA
jgi:hypothetical protein